MRDSQRQKLYAAENIAFRRLHEEGVTAAPHRFVDPMSAQVLVNRIQGWKRAQKAWPLVARQTITVQKARSDSGASYARNGAAGRKITLKHSHEWVVIHELAHHFAGLRHGHDHVFCAVYLKLVLWHYGREAHDALKKSMKEQGVRFTPPRKRKPLTDEQRAAAAARLTDPAVQEKARMTKFLKRMAKYDQLHVPCEYCGAPVGKHCSNEGINRMLRDNVEALREWGHPEREKLAKQTRLALPGLDQVE